MAAVSTVEASVSVENIRRFLTIQIKQKRCPNPKKELSTKIASPKKKIHYLPSSSGQSLALRI
jgi:hypothetical protein